MKLCTFIHIFQVSRSTKYKLLDLKIPRNFAFNKYSLLHILLVDEEHRLDSTTLREWCSITGVYFLNLTGGWPEVDDRPRFCPTSESLSSSDSNNESSKASSVKSLPESSPIGSPSTFWWSTTVTLESIWKTVPGYSGSAAIGFPGHPAAVQPPLWRLLDRRFGCDRRKRRPQRSVADGLHGS